MLIFIAKNIFIIFKIHRLQINKFISDNFTEEAIDAPLILRPKFYVFMDI